MKIGFINIFTTFWFFIMLLCSGTLIFLSFNDNVFTSDLFIVGKIILAFMILLFTGIFFYALYKFRIVIISHNSIVSIYPFLLKKEKIDLTKIKKLKMENFFAFKGTVYRKITLTDFSGTMEITDLEFENFEKLTSELKLNQIKKRAIDLKQAKSNRSNVNFTIYLLSGLLIFLIFNTIWNSGFHVIILASFVCNGILLYASIKRKLVYKRIRLYSKINSI
jgi:hypothetical protein